MSPYRPYLAPKPVIYGSFAIGLMAATAFRAIIVAQHLEPAWVRPLWYFAVLGNFVFFFHRYRISQKRRSAISDFGLREKVQADTFLREDERQVLLYLLNSIWVSKERWNYAVIFFMSLVMIAADLILAAWYK